MVLRGTKKIVNITMLFAIVFGTVSPNFGFLGNYANAQEDAVMGFDLTGNDTVIPVNNIVIVDPLATNPSLVIDPSLEVTSTIVDALGSSTVNTTNPIIYSLNAESTSTNGGGGSSGVISGPIVNNNIVVQQSSNSIPLVGGVTEKEYNALVSFYNATGGDNWTNHTNWLDQNVPVSEWYGIYANNGTVLNLNLSNNNLVGVLPDTIGDLNNLGYLDLSYNYLEGQIPPTIGKLINLGSLFLGSNKFVGQVPSEISNLSELRYLNLGGNKLSGNLPKEISYLKLLTSLSLSNNSFGGEIAEEIFDFSNLEYLNLSNNKFGGEISDKIGQLTALKYLNLSNNQLVGSIPTQIGNVFNLDSLELYNNILTGALPAEIGKLQNLNILRLDNNKLSGELPIEIGNLISLQYFNGEINEFEGVVPSSIGNLVKLKHLGLFDNKFSGQLPIEISNLRNLMNLELSNNKITGKIPAEFSELTELVQLNLSNNYLDAVADEIVSLSNLENLVLWNNSLTTIPDFSISNSLKYFSVANNTLTFEDLESNMSKFGGSYDYSPQTPVKVDSNEIILTVGDPLFLTVNVGGTANKYDWFKNGILVSSASSSPNYIKDKISASDFGLYTCKIKNDIVTGLTLTSEQIDVKSSIPLAPLAKVPGYSVVGPTDEINLNSSTPYKVTIDPGENTTSSAITYAIHLLSNSNSAPYDINADLGYIQEDGGWGESPVWLTYDQMGSSSGKIMKNLVGNTSYTLITIARNSDGVETSVLYPSFFTLVWVVPAQAITVSNITTSSVTVNWKAGGGTEHEFHIYQADYSGETSLTDLTTISIVSTTTKYSYVISGLTPSTTYNENSYFVNSQDFVYMSYASVPTFKTLSLDAITTTTLSVPVVAPVINTTNGGGSGYQAPAFITPLVGKFSAVINDSATETNSTTVKLVLNGGLAARMAISNSADFSGISQESYQITKMWTLLSGSGQKTIFIKFFDQNGSASPVVTATIKLTTGQVLGVKITHLDELITKLKYRQNGKQVNELQNELKKRGFFSKRFRTTNYYGPLTAAAVKKYKASK